MHRIEKEFYDKGVLRGKTWRFRYSEALSIIDKCRKKDVRILGIDSFILKENHTEPMMENSINLSDEKDAKKSYEISKQFLNNLKNSDFYFEIVTDERR